MKNKLILYAAFFLFGVFISSVSQVLLKKSAEHRYDVWWREYLNTWVIVGYSLFFIATLCTILAYRVIPLSMGPILESAGYVFVTVFGVRIFHERLNIKKVLGLILIIVGIVIYSM